MAKGKKYDYRLSQDGVVWRAEIVRRVTSKKTVVSKSQDGFSSEPEAQAWAEDTLQSFSESLSERNKRRAEKRKQEAEKLETQQRKNQQLKEQKRQQALDELAEEGESSPWPKAKLENITQITAE